MPDFTFTSPEGKKITVSGPEGSTVEQAFERVRNGPPPQGNSGDATNSGSGFWAGVGDFFKSIPGGAVRGLASTASAGGQAAQLEMGQPVDVPGAEQEAELLGVGALPQPQGRAGKFGEAIGEAIGSPATYLGPEGMIARLLGGAASAVGGEAAGQLTEGYKAEPLARIGGSLLGGAAPRVAAKAITPFPISPERQKLVDTLRKEGVEPTAGELTGNRALKRAESSLGEAPLAGGAYTKVKEKQAADFTRATLKRVGEDADHATPEVMDRAFNRIGKQFDDLSTRNSAHIDVPYLNKIMKAQQDYDYLFEHPLKKPIVENVIDHAVNQIINKNGVLDGKVYKAVRSRVERMRRDNKADPDVSGFLGEVRGALDDVMERSIARANPTDLGAWKEVRRQYRDMLVVEQVAAGAGEAAAEGIVSPPRLRQATVQQDKRGYTRGKGDFADMARAGNAILTPVPTSQTAERSMITNPTLFGAIGGLGGRALMSGPGQAYLKNQALTDLMGSLPRAQAQALRSILMQMGQPQ